MLFFDGAARNDPGNNAPGYATDAALNSALGT